MKNISQISGNLVGLFINLKIRNILKYDVCMYVGYVCTIKLIKWLNYNVILCIELQVL